MNTHFIHSFTIISSYIYIYKRNHRIPTYYPSYSIHTLEKIQFKLAHISNTLHLTDTYLAHTLHSTSIYSAHVLHLINTYHAHTLHLFSTYPAHNQYIA